MNELEKLSEGLQAEIDAIALTGTDSLKAALCAARQALLTLKAFVREHPFVSAQAEIDLFKNIKPLFYSQYIYFAGRYNFELQRPVGGPDCQEAYIHQHLAVISHFFDQNRAFYAYYRAGLTQLDERYFTRGGFDLQTGPEDFEADELFSTSHDYKLSKLLANERFHDHLQRELRQLRADPAECLVQLPFDRPHWTAAKVDAIELIYALKASGAVNQGNIDIASLVTLWEHIFQVDLKEAYHRFTDITNRKKEIPVFLNKLKDALLRWIDDKMGL